MSEQYDTIIRTHPKTSTRAGTVQESQNNTSHVVPEPSRGLASLSSANHRNDIYTFFFLKKCFVILLLFVTMSMIIELA